MQSTSSATLIRRYVGEIPLLKAAAGRLGFRDILARHLPVHGNEKIATVDSLLIMVYNIACGRQPVYELEHWATKLGRKVLPGNGAGHRLFNDDRFGRALDKLHSIDMASLTTETAVQVVRIENIGLDQLHNDSTTVKAYGRIPGSTRNGFFLAHGNSKDHRPDLKQLVYSLTISADGAVPVHYKAYPGNRTDDTTHIETWTTLCTITGKPDFLYVADCKVCTDTQLQRIVSHGGRVVTIMPETWKESGLFKDQLRKRGKAKRIILRRKVESHETTIETFSCFAEEQFTIEKGYRLHWIHSTEKRKRDRQARENALRKLEQQLAELNSKLNQRQLKTRRQIQQRLDKLLASNDARRFVHASIGQTASVHRVQKRPGRPGPGTTYSVRTKKLFILLWNRDVHALRNELRVDGVFPLLSTDNSISAKEALLAYKYQPHLERFSQYKSVLNAAPLLFKKIERVEAITYLYFLALILQAVIERSVRSQMKREDIDALPIYPEDRLAHHPTTAKIVALFRDISAYSIERKGRIVDQYRDDLSEMQRKVLSLLTISERKYWGGSVY
jgi:transposase